jgi:hypothetical protein
MTNMDDSIITPVYSDKELDVLFYDICYENNDIVTRLDRVSRALCRNYKNLHVIKMDNAATNYYYCYEIFKKKIDDLKNILCTQIHAHVYRGIIEFNSDRTIPNIERFKNINALKTNEFTVDDISTFDNLYYLSLCDSRILDASKLINLNVLILNSCKNISDVSMLGNIKRIEFIKCNNIRNIDNLGNVEELSIIGCKNIKNTNALQNVKYLTISSRYVNYLPHGLKKISVLREHAKKIKNLLSTIIHLIVDSVVIHQNKLNKNVKITLKIANANL